MTWSDIPGDDPTNAAMIKRDEPAAAPVAAGEDPLSEVRDALRLALETTAAMGDKNKPTNIAIRISYVLDEVRKLLVPPAAKEPAQAPIDTDPGLTVEHRPGARWSVTP